MDGVPETNLPDHPDTTHRHRSPPDLTMLSRRFLPDIKATVDTAHAIIEEIKKLEAGKIITHTFNSLIRDQALADSQKDDESVVAADQNLGEQFMESNVGLLANIHSRTRLPEGKIFEQLRKLAKIEVPPFFKELEVFWNQRVGRPVLELKKKGKLVKEILRQVVIDKTLNGENGNFLQEYQERFDYDLIPFTQQVVALKIKEKVEEQRGRADFASLPKRDTYPILLKMQGKYRKIFVDHSFVFGGEPLYLGVGKLLTEAFSDFENWKSLPTSPEELKKVEAEAASGNLTVQDAQKGYDDPDDYKCSYTSIAFLPIEETSPKELTTHLLATTHGVSTSETVVIGCRQEEGENGLEGIRAVKLVSNNSHPYQDGKIRALLTHRMMELIKQNPLLKELAVLEEKARAAAERYELFEKSDFFAQFVRFKMEGNTQAHREFRKDSVSLAELRIPLVTQKRTPEMSDDDQPLTIHGDVDEAREKYGFKLLDADESRAEFAFQPLIDEVVQFLRNEHQIKLSTWNLIHVALIMSLGVHAHYMEEVKGKDQIAPALAVFPRWLTEMIRNGESLNGWQTTIFLECLHRFSQDLSDVKKGFGIIKILSSIVGKEFRWFVQKISQLFDRKTDLLVNSDMVSMLPKSEGLGWFSSALSEIYYRVIGLSYDEDGSVLKVTIKTNLRHQRHLENLAAPITSLEVVKNLHSLIKVLRVIKERSKDKLDVGVYPKVP